MICGCDISSPEEASEGEIENALVAIELAFDLHHIDDIMVYYGDDYLHNGDDIDDVRLDWEIRLNDYQEMDLSEIEIELNDDRATASLIRRYLNNNEIQQEYEDPEDNGDISYWVLEGNDWRIWGNRAN